jgi:hypothetical protein
MNKKKIIIIIMIAVVAVALACIFWPRSENLINPEEAAMEAAKPMGPTFNADSAFALCAAQCDFGPRTMNSTAHDRCGEWIEKQFRAYGCEVSKQKADVKGYDGTVLHATNIIAKYKPERTKRVLLCAHWDSRPWADNDPDSLNHHKPVMAANDGASGVAVMLEIARLLQNDSALHVGIDFVCLDAEDWGTPQWTGTQDNPDSWALGAQYFAENMPLNPKPKYGILFDMVGGEGAAFYQEGVSLQHASGVVKRLWRAARQAGYSSYFPKEQGGFVTDDHVPLNEKAGIPTADVIPYYPDCPQSSFGPTWHTVSDTMEHIDRATLKAVGQSVVQMLWTEK